MREGRRVLIFHPALAPYRLDLFNALSNNLDLRLVFLNDNVPYQAYDQRPLREQLCADHRILVKGFSVLGRDIRYGIRAEIDAFDPEVVVTHEYSQTTLSVVVQNLIRLRRHVVWTADSVDVIANESRIRSLVRRLVLPCIDGLVVYSDEAKDVYAGPFGFRKPIAACPNLQDETTLRAKFASSLPLSRQLVQTYALAGKKVVLFVGRLARIKQLPSLLSAFRTLAQTHEDVTLVLVGDGPELADLRQLAAEYGIAGKTIFVGHREGPELYAWFNLGGIFALPSRTETWGAVVNEALVAGLPVICSKGTAARALIVPGVNGEVVDIANEESFVANLAKWLFKCRPLDLRQLHALPPPRMFIGFETAVHGFMSLLEALGPKRHT